MISEDCCEASFQRGGAEFSSLSGVLVPNRFFKKGVAKIACFIFFCSGGCWWMLVLDYKKGVAKHYKTRFFCHPLLREGKGEKTREARGQKNITIFTQKMLGP